ncbi:MAG: acyl-CoA dehydrogenase [Streptosporangiales bacterium]|nr:acyl-CoA dehydrogenase [Streptosporangiales bacterium]
MSERVALTPEQEELRESVRGLLTDRFPEAELRARLDTADGYDPALWKRLTSELGATALAVPEAYGGAGFGWREVAVVAEEAGRALYGGPLLSSSLAIAALLARGDEAACARHLPGLAAGEPGTLAVAGEDGSWDPRATTVTAELAGGGTGTGREGWRLTGVRTYVTDGHVAGLVLVPARGPDGVGLFAVSGEAVTREPLRPLDPTRRLARIELRDTPASLVGPPDAGSAAIRAALRVGIVLLAAEQLGGAQRLLEMSTSYALERTQFGRPIGQFQAVAHRCADMLLRVEAARSVAHFASWAAASGSPDLPRLAHVAKDVCSRAYTEVAAATIQLHGGIGVTWEHPAHLYYRRAKSSELLFGSAAEHRARLADLLEL